jgi:hypothetical protein
MNTGKRILRTNYQEEVYGKTGMNNLIIFGIYSVIKNGETCTYERLVAECFSKFPKVFGFRRYQQWPDSLKLDRSLRTLREKGLIIGSIRGHFELTKFGTEIAKEIGSILGANKNNTLLKHKGRSVDDKLIEYLSNSEAFKNYLENPKEFSISDSDFRSLLRCTLETPTRVLKQNLSYYKNVASSYNEDKILKFLLICEKRFVEKGAKNG